MCLTELLFSEMKYPKRFSVEKWSADFVCRAKSVEVVIGANNLDNN